MSPISSATHCIKQVITQYSSYFDVLIIGRMSPYKKSLGRNSLWLVALLSVFLVSACSSSSATNDGRIVGEDGFTRLVIPEADKFVRSSDLAYAYKADGPYASILKDCATRGVEDSCLLSELPMLHQEDPNPTVGLIMNRVLVTHDWMGLRFQELLAQLPREALKMFAPVTHIIVGGDGAERAQYNAYGNVFTVGPRILWLTADEKLAVFESTGGPGSSEEDDEFMFEFHWRYMKGDNYATRTESLESRNFDQMFGRFQTEVFYDLAFANNITYPAIIDSLPTNISTVDVFDDYLTGFADGLYAQPGVSSGSSILYQLSEAYYDDDVAPTELQSSYLPDYVASIFADDGMPMFFSYRNNWSETSRLLQLGMLSYFSDIYIDIAFTNPAPDFEVLGCDDLKIAWGVRNRLANPAVATKTKYLMEQILGQSAQLDNFFANEIGTETPLPVDAGWCDSIRLLSN